MRVSQGATLHNKENEDKTEMDNKSGSLLENSNVVPGYVALCESIKDCLDAENFIIIR